MCGIYYTCVLMGGVERWGYKMAARSSYRKITAYLPPAWARELKVIPTAGRVEVYMHDSE